MHRVSQLQFSRNVTQMIFFVTFVCHQMRFDFSFHCYEYIVLNNTTLLQKQEF